MKRIILLAIFFLTLGFIFPFQAVSQEVGTPISVVPYTITEPGYYYLTDNLTSSTNDGISVAADDVTIDLMGFALSGPGQIGTMYHGIKIFEGDNVEIRNGTIRNFKGSGICQSISDSSNNCRFINLRLVNNGNCGIYVEGNGHLIKNCTAANNINYGIFTKKGVIVTENIAYDNGRDGIYAYSGSSVIGNTAYSNDWSGIHCGSGCTVADNTAYYNNRYGITQGSNNLVNGNTAYANNQSGGSYSNIKACSTCTFGVNHAP